MRKRKTDAAPVSETRSSKIALDWENARIFLEIARRKSFRSASNELDRSVNALRRRLDLLEKQLGAKLVTRHVDGVRLTEEGQHVRVIAERMEMNSLDLARVANRSGSGADGAVTLATTEGLGTFWIAPRLIEFKTVNPHVVVDLRCAMAVPDILRMEADVAVQLERPIQKDVRVAKLGRMHLMPYAARDYIKRHGMPKLGPDLARHPLVIQTAEQLHSPEAYARQLGGTAQLGPVTMISNISGTQYFAIATGFGIGLLPTYCTALRASVIPLDLDYCAHHDIWLAYHADAANIPRVRKLIDWLIEAFSPQRYPWFADACVHPKDFPKAVKGMPPLEPYYPFIRDRPS